MSDVSTEVPFIPSSIELLMAEDLWGEHPIYSRDDWQSEVLQENTQLGYWDWVGHQLEMNGDHEHGDTGNDALGG